MTRRYRKLCVTQEVYDMVIDQCIREFLDHHPELEDMKISHDFIIRKVAEFYLRKRLI